MGDHGIDLSVPGEPFVIFARSDDASFHGGGSEGGGDGGGGAGSDGGVVVRLAAEALTDKGRLFREFARELRFPSYFGHNWDALVDCLGDLHPHFDGAWPSLVLIESADVVVVTDHFALLVDVLCDGAWQANLQLDADDEPNGRESYPLRFVFLMDRFDPGLITRRLRSRPQLVVSESVGRLLVTSNPNAG
ncbi:barstar family protein [Actinoplanes sp. NPDC051494]|uniref:barstar family protein n=1 Tax=Actinoplanes sp. NPDC051494 TaxID=3363907 RepID=UPI00378D0E39